MFGTFEVCFGRGTDKWWSSEVEVRDVELFESRREEGARVAEAGKDRSRVVLWFADGQSARSPVLTDEVGKWARSRGMVDSLKKVGGDEEADV